MNEDYELCPKCNAPFLLMDLLVHAPRCGLDPDEEFARQLQEQERKQQNYTCQNCSKKISLDEMYILDECHHKFCRPCLENYVTKEIQVSVTVTCPLKKECKAALSVNDMTNLMPKRSNNSPLFNPNQATGKATERIMNELKSIMKTNPEKSGYSVAPLDDNIYKWELKLFDFDKKDLLAQDLEKLGSSWFQKEKKHILLHIVFPKNYPFSPPYIRNSKIFYLPKKKRNYSSSFSISYRSCNSWRYFFIIILTLGGSICMEILTNKGWLPSNSLESIIMSIRAQLIEGGARLDFKTKHDYTEQEAKEAFDRMVQTHNWY